MKSDNLYSEIKNGNITVQFWFCIRLTKDSVNFIHKF